VLKTRRVAVSSWNYSFAQVRVAFIDATILQNRSRPRISVS
jgi:hypothetical protein